MRFSVVSEYAQDISDDDFSELGHARHNCGPIRDWEIVIPCVLVPPPIEAGAVALQEIPALVGGPVGADGIYDMRL